MKLTKHAWIIWSIVLVVTLALMILIPFARTATWWLATCGTMVMFGLCAFTFIRAFRKDDTLESKVLGWSIFQVGYTALLAQIVVGFILMGVAALFPWWGTAIAELFIFAVTVICLTTKDAAREFVTHSEAAVEDKTAAWRALRARTAALAVEMNHPAIRKMADEIRMADPMPTSMDDQIAELIDALSSNADDATVRKVVGLLNQRKMLAKLEKQNKV